jgi:uncharacterized protein (TIGR03083 family)
MTATAPPRTAPRKAALDRAMAMRLAAVEYDRLLAVLRELAPDEWSRPTDCVGWDVRTLAGHLLGSLEMAASVLQGLRQNRAAQRDGGGIDALTALQVREHAQLGAAAVVERFAELAPRAARGRRRVPALLRRAAIPEEQAVGDAREKWTFGFLFDVVLTRDALMHRVDICRATGRTPVLTADVEGVLVADIVDEWAQRHGRPFRLRLTGPAGGSWSSGEPGAAEELELDAVEFCRLLSGRGTGTGLLAQQVPF